MKSLLAAAVSLSLIAGSIAPVYAHDRNDHDRREWRGGDSRHDRDSRYDRHDSHRDDRRDWRNDRGHDRFDDARHYRSGYDYSGYSPGYNPGYNQGRYDQYRYDAGRYIAPRGYAVRSWRRGECLPRAYYSERYVINDYGAYRLYAPPRGHHWVRVDHDVLLTAVATGAVVAVVSNLFH